jgi:enediyne polyketide synthase
MKCPIAVVGLACRFPDARSPEELWENALAQRRAFRRIPSERLRVEDYCSENGSDPDRSYCSQAAVLEGWEFDRERFRVVGSTYRAADLAHWLSLEVASQALADAGFVSGEGLPRERTGVLLGNSLTGEFSRANLMRLRWPYVRRTVEAELAEAGFSKERRVEFLESLEERYKAPFPEPGEETLAGGLSNTIAGRICNHFDLKGGGFTIDGACASSLLAIAQACSGLAARDIDVALAGGVDLSLDPFEIVGFSRVGALAAEEMRVYDARSQGFWPGEGCGIVVLMRQEDAERAGRRVRALVCGWGVSSDGSGGITRPEVRGQLLSLERAYERADFGFDRIGYMEGHGTGTEIGDLIELRVARRARAEAGARHPVVIGSIKANIGHTKAAAGIAGFVKAVFALDRQVIPPNTACERPHPEIEGEPRLLRIARRGELWPADVPLAASVSSMGFGGINTHIAIASTASARRTSLDERERKLLRSAQDAELFLFGEGSREELREKLDKLARIAPSISRAEQGDLAASLASTAKPARVRAAIVAAKPEELAERVKNLRARLDAKDSTSFEDGIFLGELRPDKRIGFLFPGQGSPSNLGGGIHARRFEDVESLYEASALPPKGSGVPTGIAQPAIATASCAALRLLARFGIRGDVAIGHSLGELTALHWAGAFDETSLIGIAGARGRAMAELKTEEGAMASVRASAQEVEALISGTSLVVAGKNAPKQTVVSGPAEEIDAFVKTARSKGIGAARISVSHAFHSSLVAASAEPLRFHLQRVPVSVPSRPVFSTVAGRLLGDGDDVRQLLVRQVTSPVLFADAMAAAPRVDLWIEVGPGSVLAGLAQQNRNAVALSMDLGSESLSPLLEVCGAAWVLGALEFPERLFDDRFTKPFDLEWKPRFLASPCEAAPVFESPPVSPARRVVREEPGETLADLDPIEVVRTLVAKRVELPRAAIRGGDRMLSDLHLNSITVAQLVAEASRALGKAPPASPTDYANATVAEIASVLEGRPDQQNAEERAPAGVAPWTRAFAITHVERALPVSPNSSEERSSRGSWRVWAAPAHPLARAREILEREGGEGVLVCLPQAPDAQAASGLLEAAREASSERNRLRFVVAQSREFGGGSGFARTVQLEAPWLTVRVVSLPFDHPEAPFWLVAEALAPGGFREARYDSDGRRLEPEMHALPVSSCPRRPLELGSEVILATGGARGITAECAALLARGTGAKLAIVGRSEISHPEVASHLERLRREGIPFHYARADVAVREELARAFEEMDRELGAPTVILHGAGTNVPRSILAIDDAALRATLGPKVDGARNLLELADPARLRVFVAFGSIIARTGLPGEADYALANEWMASWIESWQREHASCRCLVVDWSVWSGLGMGERLGRLEALIAQGITPIPPSEGARILKELLDRETPVSVVVAGRTGVAPTVPAPPGELPFLRFLERIRVHVPEIELVTEAELSSKSDPYLEDHVFGGERVFPAVLGLEAMAQLFQALTGETPAEFERVEFRSPIIVPEAGITLRCAALADESGRVVLVLRSSGTGFQVDHFRASARARRVRSSLEDSLSSAAANGFAAELSMDMTTHGNGARVDLDPARDLYGKLLFHSGRFRRLSEYRELTARECRAHITAPAESIWFDRVLPGRLLLGDPSLRDAALHAVQACVPHATILPVAVERIELASAAAVLGAKGGRIVRAVERSCGEKFYVYDLVLSSEEGRTLERWKGVRFAVAGMRPSRQVWILPLLGPYVERRIEELLPGSRVGVALERSLDRESGEGARAERRTRALRALGVASPLIHASDGSPRPAGDSAGNISISHAGELTMAIRGRGPVGCDLETVAERERTTWRGLLGERFALVPALESSGDDEATAATRVWGALEGLKKAGCTSDAPLTIESRSDDGWALFASGPYVTATATVQLGAEFRPLVLAVTLERPAGTS